MRPLIRRHPGVEAWYIIEGEICLESPAGSRSSAPTPRGLCR
jgi:hypothetical protein